MPRNLHHYSECRVIYWLLTVKWYLSLNTYKPV